MYLLYHACLPRNGSNLARWPVSQAVYNGGFTSVWVANAARSDLFRLVYLTNQVFKLEHTDARIPVMYSGCCVSVPDRSFLDLLGALETNARKV